MALKAKMVKEKVEEVEEAQFGRDEKGRLYVINKKESKVVEPVKEDKKDSKKSKKPLVEEPKVE